MVLDPQARHQAWGNRSDLINKRMAENCLRDAQAILTEARAAQRRKLAHRAVRLSQESFELSLKGILRSIGIEYPKEHEVSDALKENSARFPEWFEETVTRTVRTRALDYSDRTRHKESVKKEPLERRSDMSRFHTLAGSSLLRPFTFSYAWSNETTVLSKLSAVAAQ